MKSFVLIIVMFLSVTLSAQIKPILPAKTTASSKSQPQKQTGKSVPAKSAGNTKAILKILCDVDATVLSDGEKVADVQAGTVKKINFEKGIYQVKIIAANCSVSDSKEEYKVTGNDQQDFWEVNMKEKVAACRRKELAPVLNSCLFAHDEFTNGGRNVTQNFILNKTNETLIYTSEYRSANAQGEDPSWQYTKSSISLSSITSFTTQTNGGFISGNKYFIILQGDVTSDYTDYVDESHSYTNKKETKLWIEIQGHCKDEIERKLNEIFN